LVSESSAAPPRRLLAALATASVLIPLNSTMIAVALPAIGETLDAGPGDLTLWLVTSYLLVNIVLTSPSGKLGDMLGRRRVFNIGLSLFALGVLLAILVPHLVAMAFSRVLMASGGAMLLPNAMALLRDVIPEIRRARAFGYFNGLLSASAAVGPLIGGVLTDFFGWKAIFLVNLPILLLCWLLVLGDTGHHRLPGERKRARFDFGGMLLLTFALTVLVLGLRGGGWWPLAGVLLGALGLFAFTRWERRVEAPLIDLELFRYRAFVIGGSITGLHNLGMYALLFQLPFLLEFWYTLDPAAIGQVLLALTAGMVVFSFVGGRVAERIGQRETIIAGVTVGLLGMLLLLFTTGSGSLAWMLLGLLGVGAAIGIVSGPMQSTGLSAVPRERSGVASGVHSTMRYLGGIAGITVISVLLAGDRTADALTLNLVCIGIYAAAYGVALLLAFGLPRSSSIY
jgi:MFS family permease